MHYPGVHSVSAYSSKIPDVDPATSRRKTVQASENSLPGALLVHRPSSKSPLRSTAAHWRSSTVFSLGEFSHDGGSSFAIFHLGSAHCGSVPSSSSGPVAGLLPAAFCGRLLTAFCCQVWVLVNNPVPHVRNAEFTWTSSAEYREAGKVDGVGVHIAADGSFEAE